MKYMVSSEHMKITYLIEVGSVSYQKKIRYLKNKINLPDVQIMIWIISGKCQTFFNETKLLS